jgi:hypothetical protein
MTLSIMDLVSMMTLVISIKCHNSECGYALSCFYCNAKCHYAECRYAECRGARPEAYTIKHYEFVKYGFRSKLVCLSKPEKVTDKKTLAYYEICPFSVHYKSVKFYSTGPSFSDRVNLPERGWGEVEGNEGYNKKTQHIDTQHNDTQSIIQNMITLSIKIYCILNIVYVVLPFRWVSLC